MLEKMGEFFDARLDIYEAHQLEAIASAGEFYPFTADCLPDTPFARVLDLGCGTGLELEAYFQRNPFACVTGIDLAPGMLAALKEKFPDKELTLIEKSFFDVPLGKTCYEAAVSVEALHHYSAAEKLPLYRKIADALKVGGYFILTDYYAADAGQEAAAFAAYARERAAEGVPDGVLCHFDTPLTVDHEIETLYAAGFSEVEILGVWGETYTICAQK